MSETWLMNKVLTVPENYTMSASIRALPGDSYDYSTVQYNEESYSNLTLLSSGEQNPRMVYEYTSDGDPSNIWINESYRTWVFLEKPTGDMLTWLQGNGVKQNFHGLKNLSSYNQDLSIPRKKDLDAKQDIITGGASTITSSNLISLRALISDTNGKVDTSAVTATELGYLDGVTGNVQTQLNNKVPTTRTVNNKALSSNITLTASDVDAIPNVPVTTTNNLDMLMVVNGNWQTDHDTAGIQNAASLIVNKWPDNVTVILKSFRRWGKLCLFTVQIKVTTQITSDYGFTLLEMPYASIDRVWINNQTQFYMDGNKVAVRVNDEKLFADYYILTGFYLTTDNARVV